MVEHEQEKKNADEESRRIEIGEKYSPNEKNEKRKEKDNNERKQAPNKNIQKNTQRTGKK